MATWILTLSVPVAVYLLLSGLDDLVVDLLYAWHSFRGHFPKQPPDDRLKQLPQKPIAVFVPLWHEHQVIERMLLHNNAAIHYANYQFFVGVYPNDHLTIQAVNKAAQTLPNVTLCTVPHPGPTSKPDCLNAIFRNMLEFEGNLGIQFSVILTHDAEDIIHPQCLRWINYYSEEYDFVQIPVLALQTPLLSLTHGIYCDEFAELHGRDMPVRGALGAFIPSSGVGTGYGRAALNRLAELNAGQIFIPGCLTEDYENGLRLKLLGFRQIFVPILQSAQDGFVATREYFPRSFLTAIKQRTRWVTGISLQSWQRNGWPGGWRIRYWLWRDRKGLLGAPLGLLTNILFALGAAFPHTFTLLTPLMIWLFGATSVLGLLRILIRMRFAFKVYGLPMAMLVPVRFLWGNAINAIATIRAQYRFAKAHLTGSALVWSKTTHEYPDRGVLAAKSRKLGEILSAMHGIPRHTIDTALRVKPEILRLGEYLVDHGEVTERQLYEALALQQQLPLASPLPGSIPIRVRRALPSSLVNRWNVLPFAIDVAGLHVCSPESPSEELTKLLAEHTNMPICFHLVTPSLYETLVEEAPQEFPLPYVRRRFA